MPADSLMNFFLVTQALVRYSIYIPTYKNSIRDGREFASECEACVKAWNLSRRCGGLHFDRGFGARRSAAPSVYIYPKCSLWQGTISHELGRDMMIIRVRITISFARNASQRVAWLLFGAQAELKKKKKAPPAS